MNHTGVDGSNVWERISKFGTYLGSASESLASNIRLAEDYIQSLYLDDGLTPADRKGHRTNIIKPEFRAVGISICGDNTTGA